MIPSHLFSCTPQIVVSSRISTPVGIGSVDPPLPNPATLISRSMTEAVRVESVEDDEEEMNLMETGGEGASATRLSLRQNMGNLPACLKATLVI